MDTAMTQQIEEKFGVAVASDEKLVAECRTYLSFIASI
jgi:hypothetical protein